MLLHELAEFFRGLLLHSAKLTDNRGVECIFGHHSFTGDLELPHEQAGITAGTDIRHIGRPLFDQGLQFRLKLIEHADAVVFAGDRKAL